MNLVDVIEGRGPSPSLVSLLLQRLPDTSLTTALVAGGRENFGWGVDRHIATDTYDALNQNTRATGNWKKPPTIPLWPRPTHKAKRAKAKTVKALYGLMQRK